MRIKATMCVSVFGYKTDEEDLISEILSKWSFFVKEDLQEINIIIQDLSEDGYIAFDQSRVALLCDRIRQAGTATDWWVYHDVDRFEEGPFVDNELKVMNTSLNTLVPLPQDNPRKFLRITLKRAGLETLSGQ